MTDGYDQPTQEQRSLTGRLLRLALTNRLVVALGVGLLIFWGVRFAPFDWDLPEVLRDPVAVDAVPDIGENQQIVFAEWPGGSPEDVDDQVTFPLTAELMGVRGVKAIRASSLFGFSSISVIFREGVDFEKSRWRLLEKLNSLPAGTLPQGAAWRLGPDATALGQIFWYTLEGRDPDGNPTGGWDLEELRTAQDWTVRWALLSAEGVSDVASVGGYVREYQVDVNPDRMRSHGVTLADVHRAVRKSNIDISAKTVEINQMEYFIRGIGFIRDLADVAEAVVKVRDGVAVQVKHVATVTLGPALRRGALDKDGVEAVGGVVVARFGANPLAVIKNVKAKIEQVSPALPTKTLPDGTVSKVTIVPFYDRTGLIHETLGTLAEALTNEVLVTVAVILLMVVSLRGSLLISATLPLAVLMCFVAMKLFGVDANIVALSGIAVAIGTIVDMGIVFTENIVRHLDAAPAGASRLEVVHRAASEVASAVVTAVLTTIVGFLPVFAMTGAEGKLFRPLAYTKTFALLASIVVALAVIPPAAYLMFRIRRSGRGRAVGRWVRIAGTGVAVAVVGVALTRSWAPLGPAKGLGRNFLFVGMLVGGLLGLFWLFRHFYPRLLGWCLRHKLLFLSLPVLLVIAGAVAWLGFEPVFAPAAWAGGKVGIEPRTIRSTVFWAAGREAFPPMAKEFMPPLDEGSFLWMPSISVHASIGAALEIVAEQDVAFRAIPEVESVVGKIGRAESPLDPAPISMIETVINYKPEYGVNASGRRVRQWRDHIRGPDDIWAEIVRAGKSVGASSASVLQPISARLVMLQTGFRASMGLKVYGPSPEVIEAAGLEIEKLLREVPGVEPDTVSADKVVGKPYIVIDATTEAARQARRRHGLNVEDVLRVVEGAIGGRKVTTVVDGRRRFGVRVRYQRELRDDIESMRKILVADAAGRQVPLTELVEIRYEGGPQVVRSENTFKVGYVTFGKKPDQAEVDVVERCRRHLAEARAAGRLALPEGVTYDFAGSYEHQLRSEATLRVIIPLALVVIFVILYLQFRSAATTSLVFAGVFVAFSGGFLLLWLYGQEWFLDFEVFGEPLRGLFGVHRIHLSVAVWVGFLALFGIATDDGVVMGTYLQQSFRGQDSRGIADIREAVVAAGVRRVRPCLMTTATTMLALLPVLTSAGRGADIMVPMAIPSFGGMAVEVLTMLVVPVLYCLMQEIRHKYLRRKAESGPAARAG